MGFSHRIEHGPAVAGSYAYHVATELLPGRCVVYDDNRATQYHVKRGERLAFRRWLAQNSKHHQRVTGAWPVYTIEGSN